MRCIMAEDSLPDLVGNSPSLEDGEKAEDGESTVAEQKGTKRKKKSSKQQDRRNAKKKKDNVRVALNNVRGAWQITYVYILRVFIPLW